MRERGDERKRRGKEEMREREEGKRRGEEEMRERGEEERRGRERECNESEMRVQIRVK
jgi:hypothetical protein